MEVYDIFELVSYFVGMLIHFILLGQLLRRKRRSKAGLLFFALLLSASMWHFGNFATYFLNKLFGPNPHINILNSSFSIFIVAGLSLLPSLLLHTLVTFFFQKELNFNKKLQAWVEWGIYSIYFPLLFLPVVIYQLFVNTTVPYTLVLRDYLLPFNIWMIAVLVMAGFTCFKIYRVGWEKEERGLFFTSSWCLFAIAASLIVIFFLENRPGMVEYTDFLVLFASLLPTLIFFYYVYRYNYMDFVIKRGFVYSILITTTVLLYLNGVQKLTRFFGLEYGVNAAMLQSLFVLALVFAFRPFRTHTAEVLDRFFFKEQEIYKEVYRDLTQQIRGGSVQDMPALLRQIVQTLKKTMELDHAALVFFYKRAEALHVLASTVPFKVGDFVHTISFVEEHKRRVLNQGEVDDEGVIREMENVGADIILPIYLDQELIGLLNLGKRIDNRRIHSDELEMLLLLTNQLATEIQNMRLLEEKITLERELLKNEKLLALGRLSASVAHQVKNPLSSIKIITQVLREDLPPGDPRDEDMGLVINEIDKLARVVNQLLDFAKPAQQEEEMSSDLEQVVDEVVMVMQFEANKFNVKIRKEIKPNLPKLRGDRMTLHDILSNLIQNSIQALEKKEGDGEVVIRTHRPPLPYQGEPIDEAIRGKMVTVEISDNGQGIPEETMENIFEPFFTTKQRGTGLGLPIVKQRLVNIGGKIDIQSHQEKKVEEGEKEVVEGPGEVEASAGEEQGQDASGEVEKAEEVAAEEAPRPTGTQVFMWFVLAETGEK